MARPLKGQERPKIDGSRLQILTERQLWATFKLMSEYKNQNPQRNVEKAVQKYLETETSKWMTELGIGAANGTSKNAKEKPKTENV